MKYSEGYKSVEQNFLWCHQSYCDDTPVSNPKGDRKTTGSNQIFQRVKVCAALLTLPAGLAVPFLKTTVQGSLHAGTWGSSATDSLRNNNATHQRISFHVDEFMSPPNHHYYSFTLGVSADGQLPWQHHSSQSTTEKPQLVPNKQTPRGEFGV